MGLRAWFHYISGRAPGRVTSQPDDTVFSFLEGLVTERGRIAEPLRRYGAARSLSSREREIETVQAYLSIERAIVQGDPPIARESYTVARLREAIRSRITVDALSEPLWILFFPPGSGQAGALFAFGVRDLVVSVAKHLGEERLRVIISSTAKGTVLEGAEIGPQGVDVKRIAALLASARSDDVIVAFRALVGTLYRESRDAFGERSAKDAITSAFRSVRDRYDYELIALFLRVVPEELFLRERLTYLSREELERQAESAVSERVRRESVEKTAEELRQTVEDLNRTRASLREERDRLTAILSSMGEGLLVVDRQTRILLMNQKAAALLDVSEHEFEGRKFGEALTLLSGNEELAGSRDPIVRAFVSSEPISAGPYDNLTCRTANGKTFPVAFVVSPLWREGIAGAVMVFTDISEQKRLDEARSGFISTASHQLRTPLTSMRWFSELMLDEEYGTLTDRQRHFVRRINDAVLRMVSLVNLLLQIARLEAGRVAVEPMPIDLKALTLAAVQAMRSVIEAKRQHLEVLADPDPPQKIMIDQDMIWQVVQNLLSNASRYSPPESTITVNIVRTDEFVEYSVRDQGIGIPKLQQGRIFEKFFRATNATKLVPEGSGLGLTLVKALVAEWGGKIWFESEEGKGTTFHMTLPLAGMMPRAGEVRLAV